MTTGPDPIDIHVGKRLKQRRVLLGMSQEKLAASLGITFQQIQKYENGSNRVGASRLFQIGKVLDAPVSFFFDGYSPSGKSTPLTEAFAQIAEDTPDLAEEEDLMNRKETLELVRAYYAIPNPKIRKKMLDMLRSLTDEEEE